MSKPSRFRDAEDFQRGIPVHVVWELTLACNLRCSHCGSRAGKRRVGELSTDEALDVVASLARLGTRELTLIGGEAYLRRDWCRIIEAAHGHGMYVGMQTGARALTEARLKAAVDAGLDGIGVSLDGLADLHDEIRGVAGSFEHGLRTLQRARELGLRTSVNTQIGPRTSPELPELLNLIAEVGVGQWQLQLTVAMGNAVDNSELILQPYQLLELMPLLAELYIEAGRRGILLMPGNNIGYFGPYESLWRTSTDDRPHWGGCAAGETVIGIESDGTVKGCPSLATVPYGGGNVRELGLGSIWDQARINGSLRPKTELWGFCKTCYYADVCRAGCTWTSQSLLGRAGNNPYCHHRVLTLAESGRRERITKLEEAGPTPFAVGRFALIEEPLEGEGLARDTEITSSPPLEILSSGGTGASPAPRIGLRLCHGCSRFVHANESHCPFCACDLDEADREHESHERYRRQLMDEVRALLADTAGRG